MTRPVPQRGSSERRVAAVVALVGAVAFVALAAVFVPWDPVPGGGTDLLARSGDGAAARAAGARRGLRRTGPHRGLVLAGGVDGRGVLAGLHPGRPAAGRAAGHSPGRVVVGAGARGGGRGLPARPAGDPAVLRRVLPSPRLLRPVHAGVARLVARRRCLVGGQCRRHLDRAPRGRRHRATLENLVARGRRGPGCRARDARLVRLPGPGGAALQRLRATAGRSPARRGAASWRRPRGCTSRTSWSPTRPAVRRRSTPTCRGSAAPAGWCSTTTWCAACRGRRPCRWSPTSWATRATTTSSTGRCWGRPVRSWGSACWAWCWADEVDGIDGSRRRGAR